LSRRVNFIGVSRGIFLASNEDKTQLRDRLVLASTTEQCCWCEWDRNADPF